MSDEANADDDGGQKTLDRESGLAADVSEQMRVRLAKAERLRAAGIEPYPAVGLTVGIPMPG